jgi:site-specific recombinase XerD
MVGIKRLPKIYEDYLSYCLDRRESAKKISQARRVITALNAYLDKTGVDLCNITIQQIDAFDEELNFGLKLNTRKSYLTQLRGFIRYLHLERKILRTNLAKLINSPHTFPSQNHQLSYARMNCNGFLPHWNYQHLGA